MQNKELIFKFNQGMDAFNPAITDADLVFQYLLNACPQRNRLCTPNQFAQLQTGIVDGSAVSQFIVDFAATYDPNGLFSWLFAFGTTEAFVYIIGTGLFAALTTPFTYASSSDPFASVVWDNKLYVTRLNVPIYTLVDNSAATEIDSQWESDSGNITGRYMVSNNGHLVLGYINDGLTINQVLPTRIRWSDLLLPGSTPFLMGTGSEADYEDFEPIVKQITGLSSQRGVLLIFFVNAVWTGTYVGGSEIYEFKQLFSKHGNIFHYAHIQVEEIDYYISYNGFYKIDGFQKIDIGTNIWRQFIQDNPGLYEGAQVRAYHDPTNYEVFWLVYPPATTTTYEYVYNYKLQLWSIRYAQNKHGCLFPETSLNLTDGVGGFDVYEQPIGFIGTDQGEISIKTNDFGTLAKAYYNGDNFSGELITFEFDLSSYTGMKQFDQVKLLYSRTGDPALNLFIGTRRSQSEAVNWSDALLLADQSAGKGFEDGSIFQFGITVAHGQFVQFKLTWDNTNTNHIDEIYGISLMGKVPVTQDANR